MVGRDKLFFILNRKYGDKAPTQAGGAGAAGATETVSKVRISKQLFIRRSHTAHRCLTSNSVTAHYKSAAGNGGCDECPARKSTGKKGATSADDCQGVHFPGSRIIMNNATWDASVNTWVFARTPRLAQVWGLCYSSFTDDATSPAAFHQQCDQYSKTVMLARNSQGYVFGGYAAGPWSKTSCCAVSTNTCNSDKCVYRTASDFLFRLQPDGPQRYLPKGNANPSGASTEYHWVGPSYWPCWGGGADLCMGTNVGGMGTNGHCSNQGTTYEGDYNEVCGGRQLGSHRHGDMVPPMTWYQVQAAH